MTTYPQSVPSVPSVPVVDGHGIATPVWYQFFITLLQRTGGSSGNASLILDTLSSTVGAILTRASGGWIGLAPASKYNVLRMGATSPEWDTLDGNSFATQSANVLFAGPASGPVAEPVFRALASADLSSVAGAVPGIKNGGLATSGNVGEYINQNIPSGSAIALSSGSSTDIASISLTAGDWDIWATAGLSLSGGATMASFAAWVNTISMTDPGSPNAGAYLVETPPSALTGFQTKAVGVRTYQLASTTTIYLTCHPTYSGGTLLGFGFIGARRVR